MRTMNESKHNFIVHSENPYNAEPPLDRLRASLITPVADFYVRSHGNVPRLDEQTHRLKVSGLVEKPLTLSMTDIRQFSPTTVTAMMQCAGNRRGDMRQVKPVQGDPWAPGALGNAKWTGVALADVLRAAGADTRAELHVVFTACDDCSMEGENFRYCASIPMGKATSPEVLLAYEMNGEKLTPEHGFPLRAVVPGFAGVRCPKWLSGIAVQDEPSDGFIQARDYKFFPADATEETADWDKGMTIYELPLNSAICEPAPYAVLKAGLTPVRGYATSSVRKVARVDVSIDGGRSWRQAELEHDPRTPWSWTFWEINVELHTGDIELVVRAWDTAGQTQPESPDDTWNFKGYLSAAWHRIKVNVS
jgi:sulfite oxidase